MCMAGVNIKVYKEDYTTEESSALGRRNDASMFTLPKLIVHSPFTAFLSWADDCFPRKQSLTQGLTSGSLF